MCGSKRSLICCLVFSAIVVGVVVYTALKYEPQTNPSTKPEYYVDEGSWGGYSVANGRLFADRASTEQIQGTVLIMMESNRTYLRFEKIKKEGENRAAIFILTGAPFPTSLAHDNVFPVELDGTPNGLFMKSGSFNQHLPNDFDFHSYHGAILWDVANKTLIANVSFE